MNDDNISNNGDNVIDSGDKIVNQDEVQDKSRLEDLKKEVEDLRKLNEEYLAGWKRAKADYLNLEAQSGKRLSVALERELADVILRFLPVYEIFSKSLEHFTETPEEARKGLEAAVGEFWKTLKDLGIDKIKTEGAVDPNLHDVLLKQKKEGTEPGVIIQEVASGYTLGGKLLKPARVIVAE